MVHMRYITEDEQCALVAKEHVNKLQPMFHVFVFVCCCFFWGVGGGADEVFLWIAYSSKWCAFNLV